MKTLSVPLLKQSRRLDCGPTALRMVLLYFGEKYSSKEIIADVGGIKDYGIKNIKLADFARGLGFKVRCYSYNQKLARGRAEIKKPSKSHILRFLKRRLPVIIAVRSSLLYNEKHSEEGHFIVVTGYKKGKWEYNDPHDGRKHRINEEDLMFAWFNNVLDSSAYLLVVEPKKGRRA